MEKDKKEEIKVEEKKEPIKKKKNPILIVLITLATIVAISIGYIGALMLDEGKNTPRKNKSNVEKTKLASDYKMTGNDLQKFDIEFLKLENNSKNMIYSPLSIKYALQMISEGAKGNSKDQIDAIIGDYKYRKYKNSSNISFANAMFIRDTYKNSIKQEYIDNLKNRYNADVITDSFNNASNINKWVKDKTFNLIDGIEDDASIQNLNFDLVNALAIDMEWDERKLQDYMYVWYQHETLEESKAVNDPCDGIKANVEPFSGTGIYQELKFNDGSSVNALKFETYANNYDAVNTIGKENIINNISKGYKEYKMKGDSEEDPYTPSEEQINKYVNQYLEDINEGYQKIESTTNLNFYVDDEFNVFSKDLKSYDGVKLEYVAVMPKKQELKEYIKNMSASSLNELISKVKSNQNINSFEPGYLTIIEGKIPLFKYDYDLSSNLKDILNQMGIKDIFDSKKTDMSNLTTEKNTSIDTMKHKATIEFSNDGIKAAAVTGGGAGDACAPGYNYLYKVPVKRIDMTFDKPYLYLIRDKATGEVWFVGTVYNPTKYSKNMEPTEY